MHDQDHAKPKGLKLRGQIWWIDKTVGAGEGRRQLRESTGCRTLAEAVEVLKRRERDFSGPAPDPSERRFYEAAAEYIADLERRGKSSERADYALRSIMPEIGNLPLSHIHQRAIQPWVDAQHGARSSATVERTLQVVSTVLRYAAEVLRDGNRPWLNTAPPRLSARTGAPASPARSPGRSKTGSSRRCLRTSSPPCSSPCTPVRDKPRLHPCPGGNTAPSKAYPSGPVGGSRQRSASKAPGRRRASAPGASCCAIPPHAP